MKEQDNDKTSRSRQDIKTTMRHQDNTKTATMRYQDNDKTRHQQ